MKKKPSPSFFRFTGFSHVITTLMLIFLLVICTAYQVAARDVSGVRIDEQINSEQGSQLILNGAGIRSKFFFKIYIGALYLEKGSRDAAKIIETDSVKRIVMHFLYDEVSKEKLVDGWNEGFENNTDSKQLAQLGERIKAFNAFFDTVHAGDVIVLEYQPQIGTGVIIKGKRKGLIVGKDFNDALLRIWLGKDPVTTDLKKAMLDFSQKK